MSVSVPETERDQAESGFTEILRRLLRAEPAIEALIFVDHDGECIDYCSVLPPYDVKVAGAQMQVVVAGMREPLHRLLSGELTEVQLYCDRRDIIARRVDDEYLLVAIVRAGGADEYVVAGVGDIVERLRDEAMIPAPFWDDKGPPLEVSVREAIGWGFAPTTVTFEGAQVPILDVLGRWRERGGAAGGELVCFRVRIDRERELTLAYDMSQTRWFRWY
ncbi:MAG: hypothetical protein H5U40_12090 [Polyangiaceae bacterium]|nr:hypothetical protein [Polyangiaceae bacterium]